MVKSMKRTPTKKSVKKTKNPKKSTTKKGMVRKTARRAYMEKPKRKSPKKSKSKSTGKPKRKSPKKSKQPKYRKKSKVRKSKKAMVDNEFYCLKSRCRRKIPADCICVKKMKNNRMALRAWCEKSDMYLFKFIKDSDSKRLMDKFGKC